MNTRTMRREVYEAHEMMRKSQIRKRCISRCRRAFLRKLKNVGIAVILVAVAVAAVVKSVENFNIDTYEKQAKTAAYVPEIENTDIMLLDNPFTSTYYVSTLTANLVNFSQAPSEGAEESPNDNIDSTLNIETSMSEDNVDQDKSQESVADSKPVIMEEVTSTDKDETNEPIEKTNQEEVATPEEHEVVTCDTVLEFPVVGADGYSYTEEDYKYLLMIIVGESQNCSKEHQMYVGSVVLNRLHNKKYFSYADCIKDIALAPNQYTCFNGPNAYRDPTDLNIEVAKELILYGSVLPSNVIFQAQFKQGQGVYIQLGNTYFCWKD